MENEATVVINNETVNEETGEVLAIVDEPTLDNASDVIVTDIKILKKIVNCKDNKKMSVFYLKADFYGNKTKEVALGAPSVKTFAGSIADRQFFVIMNDIFDAGEEMFLTLTPYEFEDKKGFQYGVCVKNGNDVEFQMKCTVGSVSDKAVMTYYLRQKKYIDKV